MLFNKKLPDIPELIIIPSGTFMMGSTLGNRDETPVLLKKVKGFSIGKYPVTQAQWKRIMGYNPSYFKKDDRPVGRITWDEAKEFCQKLSENTGMKYTLPTETQWEYACRAGTTTEYCFGKDINSSLVNFGDNYGRTKRVYTLPCNSFGISGMHGNIWEWCEDDYGYYGRKTDPLEEPGLGTLKVVRGGSYKTHKRDCRSSSRNYLYSSKKLRNLGFRVVSQDVP